MKKLRYLFTISIALMTLTLLSTDTKAQNNPKVTDAEIGSIVVTANQIDVNYGKLALQKSKSSEVRHFAQTMIKDHESLIAATKELAAKLGVTPKDNSVTQSLLKGERETTAKLKKLRGSAFDKAYIDNEVAYHDAVISTVKNVLIPQAKNQELKETLIKVTPLLEHHLQMAKDAQAKLR